MKGAELRDFSLQNSKRGKMRDKMKSKTKKIIYRIIKIIWFSIGGIIALWNLFWFIKIITIENIGGVIAGAVLFGAGLYWLLIFILITAIFLLIKSLICKSKK